MLRSPDEAHEGRVVYLYPHSRTAGQWCWKHKTAVVIDTKHWPRVHVSFTHAGEEVEAYPHKDDVRLRPAPLAAKATKRQGDMTGDSTPAKVRVMSGKDVPIVLPAGVEQGMLF